MKTDMQTRYAYLELYIQGKINPKELSQALKLSRQQVYRLIKNYKEQGITGLIHKGRNPPSNHKISFDKKSAILSLIRNKYYDCGASYASELLEEYEGIKINRETLRLWMKQEQLLIKQRKRKPYRRRRERKTAFGEMLQIDGCFDYWFRRDKQKVCLINLIDDAISYNLCYFDEEETIRAATIVLWQWVKKFGIPQSIYCPAKSTLLVKKTFSGKIFILFKSQELSYKILSVKTAIISTTEKHYFSCPSSQITRGIVFLELKIKMLRNQ